MYRFSVLGGMGRKHQFAGQTFGRLSVISEIMSRKWGTVWWNCLCTCGTKTIVSGRMLYQGRTKSCGCWRREFTRTNTKPIGHSLLWREFRQYQKGAISRGHAWGLTFERFKELLLADCHYCGQEPCRVLYRQDCVRKIKCNGIDRKKNALGYVEGNVVSCCSDCNYLKSDRDHDDFLNHICRISQHGGVSFRSSSSQAIP